MGINFLVPILFYFTAFLILLITAAISIVLTKTYTGKSINDQTRPPVRGTVFHQFRHMRRLYDYHTDITRKSPTFRLLTPDASEIFTTDVGNVEHMVKTRFENYQKVEYAGELCRDLLGHGIFVVSGDKWLHQRKLASVEFSARVLRDSSCWVFRKSAARWVEKISKVSVENKAFDIKDLFMKSAMDSTSRVVFGEDLNCLDGTSTDGIGFMNAFDQAHEAIFWRFVDPFWRLKRALNIGSEAVLKQHLLVIDSFVHGVIRRRRKRMQEQELSPSDCASQHDILSRFLLGNSKQADNDPDDEMSDKFLRDVFVNFMFAGKDTTAFTLSWFVYILCKNPSVQERIAQEVENVVLAGSVQANDFNSFVELLTDEALEKMHYLYAALTETLRLYPVVPIDGRAAMEDDVLPDGYTVKKGDNLYYVSYAMGRMPYIWGDQAEAFLPERWLDHNGVFKPESQFKFVSFHGGPRMCLGKDFAYRLMMIMSAALIHFFRLQLADDTKSITYKVMFNLQINGGLFVNALPRSGDVARPSSGPNGEPSQKTGQLGRRATSA